METTTLHSRFPEIVAELHALLYAELKTGAELVEASAKSKAPVASGDLRDSIHVEEKGTDGFSVIAGDEKVFYAHLVEHGTTHSAPEPFLVPALHESEAEIVSLVKASLRKL